MKDVIIACDFSGEKEFIDFLNLFDRRKPYIKIGMELFYAVGPKIVKDAKDMGHKVFLDLKLHDIPNTVKRAMSVLSLLNADMVNLHAAGTKEMMEAALMGLTRTDGTRPILIAVTQLTSTSEERMKTELLINKSMEETVIHYARNAKNAGLDGVVCSPLEASKVKAACGESFLTVTPGVRFEGESKSDQVRVTTPALARKMGSDYIVMGRSITGSKDPVAAYSRALKDFLGLEGI